MIEKELQISQHAQGSTSSTTVTNSVYHTNVNFVTIRSYKGAKDEEDHFIEVDL